MENYKPSWDQYFAWHSKLASLRSSCKKKQVGCVLVSNNRIVSTGYNGTISKQQNCNETDISLEDHREWSLYNEIHAELNALLFLDRFYDDLVLYCSHSPCKLCAKMILQKGIKRVVYIEKVERDFEFIIDYLNELDFVQITLDKEMGDILSKNLYEIKILRVQSNMIFPNLIFNIPWPECYETFLHNLRDIYGKDYGVKYIQVQDFVDPKTKRMIIDDLTFQGIVPFCEKQDNSKKEIYMALITITHEKL